MNGILLFLQTKFLPNVVLPSFHWVFSSCFAVHPIILNVLVEAGDTVGQGAKTAVNTVGEGVKTAGKAVGYTAGEKLYRICIFRL